MIYTGTKITSSNQSNTFVINEDTGETATAKPGDVYVNADSGKIYTWNGDTNKWEIADGSLKGPVGESLKKVDSFTVTTRVDTEDPEYDSDFDTNEWMADGPSYTHLINHIEKLLQNDCKNDEKYIERINNFFKYTDKNNCKRVHDWIKND